MRQSEFRQIISSSTAVFLFGGALLWLWCIQPDDTVSCSQKSSADPVVSESYALLPNCQIIPGVVVKRHNQTSVRRMDMYLPASSFLAIRNITPCRTANAVPPTPALHPAVSPATFVRAGPDCC